MKRAIQILAFVGIAASPLASHQATAWADDAVAEEKESDEQAKREAAQRLAKDERIRIDRYATIEVYLNPHVTTTISTDKPIDFTKKPKWKELNFERRLCHVTLQPSSLPPRRNDRRHKDRDHRVGDHRRSPRSQNPRASTRPLPGRIRSLASGKQCLRPAPGPSPDAATGARIL